MLTPDTTEDNLKNNASAASVVTEYAQATITAVPTLPNPPDWFEPIQNDITTAQNHAQNWVGTICPAVTTGIPQGIISFNETFQAKTNQILNIVQEIQSASGQPDSAQRADIAGLFDDLNTAMGQQATAVGALQNQIVQYSNEIKTDQSTLAADLGNVSERFINGQVWIQQLTTSISDNFLDSQVLGPCSVIVTIDMNIQFKIQGVGADPSIITLVFAKAILENQVNNSSAAQNAVQAVLDSWTTLQAKNQAVIADLKDAQDAQYISVLVQVDLQTAQTQWQQLSDFASSLIS